MKSVSLKILVLVVLSIISCKQNPQKEQVSKNETQKGNIEVFSQGGIGIAEAVDEDPNYFDKNLKNPRSDYKGPSLDGILKIDKTLFDIYMILIIVECFVI